MTSNQVFGSLSEPFVAIPFDLNEIDRELGTDDTLSNHNDVTSTVFGSIVSSFASTLSGNPFQVNFQQSLPVIVLMGCMMAVSVLGLLYFIRWDRADHDEIIYVKKDKHLKKTMSFYEYKSSNTRRYSILYRILGDQLKVKPDVDLTEDQNNSKFTLIDYEEIFPKHLLHRTKTMTIFWRGMLREHTYFSPFCGSSLFGCVLSTPF
jgi:hypothetical protein